MIILKGNISFMSKVAKNFFYNISYQALVSVIPIILMPYLSRTLGVKSLGIYSYTNSVVLLFSTFGMLGLSTYSSREIAYSNTKGQKELSKTFESLCILRAILFAICFLFYLILVLASEYGHYFILHIFLLAFNFFDISWLFIGIEEMKIIVIRNSILKIISTLLVFLLVKDSGDVGLYILINGGSLFLGILIMLPKAKKYIKYVKLEISDISKHIIPIIKLFLPQAATSLYVLFDKTMIKLLTDNVKSVGYYDQGQSISKMPLVVASSLSTVLLPRISNEYAKGNMDSVKKYLNRSTSFMLIIAFPLTLGLVGISDSFIPWFLGEEFIPCIPVLQILSIAILPVSLSNVTGIQYLTAFNRTRELTVSYTAAALLDIVLNFLLIPIIGIYGAAVGTVIAEFEVFYLQYRCMRKEIGNMSLLKKGITSMISSLIMFIAVRYAGTMGYTGIKETFLQISIGGFCYLAFMFLINIKKLQSFIKRTTSNKL